MGLLHDSWSLAMIQCGTLFSSLSAAGIILPHADLQTILEI